MADIRLAKPAAGTTQTVPSAPDGRFIFDFPADAATLTRSGDNLVLTFEDGASIQLQGFYTTYSKEEMPSFQVDGVEISGQDFFAALGEDLMPAAGPAAGSSAARGGRYNEYGGSDLLDGIDHLGRLDVGFDGGVQLATDTVEPSPWYEGDGWVDHGVTVTPLDSDAAAEVVTVHEAGLANGTTPGAADAPVSAGGSLIINAPDGVASIVIGNVTVFENGALTGNTVSTDEGTLTVTGYDPATGRLDFNYTLDRNTTEHDKSDPATDTQISHDLTVTVTDTDGDSGSTTITVNVVDDGPKINLTGASSGLLVDETFGSNGSQDVNDGGTGTATLDASRLFDVDGGADGVADMSYSLTLSQQPNDLTAIVDGQEYNVTFAVFNGQVHAMAGNTGKDIFTVSINEDTGEVTLQLTGKGSLKHPTSSNDDEILNNIIDDINVKLTVTDNDGDVTSSEVQLEIQVEDDAVQVTSAGEPKLELDESDLHGTGVQDVVNVSNNFTVVASADGEAGRSYELTLDPGAENPLVAFVGGEMMPVILSINNEGRIVGMAGDTEIFNVHVDSNGNVTFTLENNGTLVHPDNSDPDDVLSLNGIGVKLTVTDGDGDSSSAEIALDLTIRDDGPVARADNVTLTEAQAQAQAGGSGANVLDNDVFGADAPAYKTVSSVNGGNPGEAVNGTYGTLTLNADGTYTYTLTPGVDVPNGETYTEEFSYTIKDADGDTSEATLTITIKGDENVPVVTVDTPGAGDANIMVDEGSQPEHGGAGHGQSGNGSFIVDLKGEDGTIEVGGFTITIAGGEASTSGEAEPVHGVTLSNVHAELVDGKWTVSYGYELGGRQEHGADNSPTDETLTGEFPILVTDATGDTATGNISVAVHDDVPVLVADTATVTEGTNTMASGNVTANDNAGADGFGHVEWKGLADGSEYTLDGNKVMLNGKQVGTLTLAEEGAYTFALESDYDVPQDGLPDLVLNYRGVDTDGDSADSTLTITISGDTRTPVVTVETPGAGDANIMVDEGSQPEHGGAGHGQSGNGSFIVDLKGEDGTIEVGGFTITIAGGEASTSGEAEPVHGVTLSNVHAELVDGKWTVSYGYELGGRQEHGADNSPTDETLTGEFPILVTDATGDTAEGTLTVEVHDDGPTITASDMSTTLVPGSGAGNLADGEAADFTKGTGGQSLGHSTSLPGWDDVTMYAAKVTYSGSGDNVQISGIDDSSDYTLKYSPYNTNHPAADKGLTVDAGNYTNSWWGETQYDPTANHNEEISVIKDEDGKITQSEAVVFDLGGQLAYGVTIDFGAFYNGKPGAEGTTQWDHVSEKALVTFYRDGEIVGSTIVEGNSSTGTFTLNSSDVVLGGFDKVVISAVDNRTDVYRDEHSDFTIQGIDFITKRDDPFIVSEGTVTAASGADGFADAYADSHVQFDLAGMVNEDSLSEDGTSGTVTVLVDGNEQTVKLELSKGSSGESILTGTLQESGEDGKPVDGEQLFTATLDKDGNWTMEQYEQFRVPGDGQESNQFELVFKTEDADGDVASTTVHVPLEVVDQTPATDTSIDNGNDTITITGGEGIAGTVAAGDSGGVEVQTTVQPGQDYNISIMLDLSGSMADPLHSDTNTSRIEMAVDALKNFFETSLQNHDGDISLQLVGFGTDVLGTRTWTIDGDASDAEKQQVYDEFANQLSAWQKNMNSWGYSQGTNYEAAMEKATEWFSDVPAQGGVAGNGGENLAFFISDGQPTYYYYDGTDWWGDPTVGGEGNHSDQATVQATLEAAQDLQNAGGGVQVNAIGIGNESLHEKAQTILDLIDNTGGSGQTVEEYPYQHKVVVDHDWLGRPKYEWQWTTGKWSENNLVEGDSDLVNSEDGLTAALVGGGVITSTDLADAGDDTIRAEHATSSTIIYGDVMNTDRLRYELIQTRSIAAALVAAGIDYGSGADVFQWLENAANANALKGTKFEGWTHDDSVKYMLQHAEELGYETRVDADGDFYLVKADGTVLNMDGAEADNVELDTLTGRVGGNDTIIGSQADDVIYGQEGNDLLVGDAPSESGEGSTVGSIEGTTVASIKAMDTDDLDAFIQSVEGPDADGDDRLFGGTGDDVLLGMGGDDYIDGGAGEDAIFGGSGNDIIVYDSNDYLVSGGSGIDFMVSDNSTLTLTELLSGGKNGKEGPIVDSIEVLLKGDAALSLTSLDQLAKDYGITLDTNAEGKETLILDMDKWTKTADGIYAFNGGAEDGDLTLETNLTPVEASDPASEAVQQQVFTLEHGNG